MLRLIVNVSSINLKMQLKQVAPNRNWGLFLKLLLYLLKLVTPSPPNKLHLTG